MTNTTRVEIPDRAIPAGVVGWWKYENDDTTVRIHFSRSRDGKWITIRVIDSLDGEELRVSEITYSGGELAFDTVTPSNGYRTSHKWRFEGDRKAQLKLTMTETWVRASEENWS